MRDHVANTVQSLSTLLKNMDSLETVSDELKAVTAKLLAGKSELEKIEMALKTGRGLLSEAQERATRDHNVAMYNANEELKNLGLQCQQLVDNKAALLAQVHSIRAEHDQVLASMGSLRDRLAVGAP